MVDEPLTIEGPEEFDSEIVSPKDDNPMGQVFDLILGIAPAPIIISSILVGIFGEAQSFTYGQLKGVALLLLIIIIVHFILRLLRAFTPLSEAVKTLLKQMIAGLGFASFVIIGILCYMVLASAR